MRWFRKRRALRRYRGPLARKLRDLYGVKRHYAPEEVRDAAQRNDFATDYLCYALAMYCERAAFDADHAARGESCSYDLMRLEIARTLFGGDTSFDGESLTMPSHDGGWFSSDSSDCSSDGGAFDGGGCDGGD